MELKRISKKLIASLMLTIIVLAQFSNYRFVTEAAVIAKADSLKLALSEKNPETNWGYSINGNKKIWNIVDKTTGKSGSNLYCIKAEYGETWLGTPTTTVTYDKSYNAYELSSTNLTTSNTANTLIKSTANYSALLWIADNVFMPGENKTTFLSKMGITWDADEEMYVLPNTDLIGEEEFPTDDDIIAVQQAAIWYYTNYKVGSDSTYNLLNNDSWLKYIANGTTDYNQLSQNANYGEGRNKAAMVIYNKLVTGAANAGSSYTLKNRDVTLWLSGDKDEQPIIQINKITPKVFDLALRKAIVSVTKNGNAKTIENARSLNADGSIQNVDSSTLYKTASVTTATYKHRKDPVLVETGDHVKYSFTIYNEGEQAGVATEITDKLPGTASTGIIPASTNGQVTSSTGNVYTVSYDSTTNVVKFKLNGDAKDATAIPAYDGTLHHETVVVDFVVKAEADDLNTKILTNVAYISEEYNSVTKTTITSGSQDNDSKPATTPTFNNTQNGITYGDDMGYTGNSSNSADLTQNGTYYKGQQDDDDFEKIMILPINAGKYDLKLTKVSSTNSNTKLQGAKFKVTLGNNQVKEVTTGADGTIKIEDIALTKQGKQTITIEETAAPSGYKKLLTESIKVELNVVIENRTYKVESVTITNADAKGSTVNLAAGSTDQEKIVELTVPNEPKTGKYNIQLEKVDSLNNATKLQGAEFEVKVNGGTAQKLTTDENGQLNINDINLTAVGKQTITIKETKAPNGYNKLLTGDLTIEATVGEDADKFKVTGVTITSGSESGSTAQVVQGTINTVKVTVPNEKITGKYNLQVIKVDSNNSNTKLQGAEFEVKVNGGTVQKLTTDENGQLSINDIKLENQEKQTITIKETKAPDGYYQLLEEELTLEATVGLEDGKYKVTNVQIKNTDKKGSTAVLEGSTVKVTVPNEKITGKYNLQLVKVDKDDTTKTLQGAEFEIKVNGGEAKTATTDSNGQLSINDLVIESKGKQTITIKETKAPEGYKKILTGELTIEATVEVIDNKYEVTSAQITSSNANGSSVRFVEDRAGAINKVIVTVPNEKITGKYNLQLIKVDSNDTSKKLSGAEFEIKVNGGEARTATTDTNGQININDLILESKGKQTITIKETNAPNKYKISLTEELTIEATVDVVNDEYKVTSAVIKNADAKGSNVTLDGSTVKVTVPNEKIVGNYNIKVVKEDVNGNKLAGAKFKVELLDNQNNVVKTYENLVTNAEGVAQTENIQVSEEATYTYRVTETEAPSKYIKEDTATIIKVTSKFVDGEYAIEYQKVSGNEKEISLTGNTVQVTMVNKQIDLALRKSITKLNDTDVNRLPDVDSTKLANKTETTANYNHAKTPVLVDTGDYIVYTLRIYNEGTIGAYAGEIKDYLPAGIKYIEGINTNGKYKIEASSDGRTLTITNVGKQVIPAYNGEGTPKYDEIQIKCQITAERTIQPVTLTNIAEITKYIDEKGTERTSDRDSEPGNFPEDKKTDRENYNGSGKDGNYVKGQQDDDDFERVILRQQFDLSLRKVITEVDGVSTGNDRKINITGLSELKDGTQTTANYNHVKTPVTVENGSIVKYNINIYNEAAVDGIATIVKDQLPTGVKLNLSSLTAEGEKYYLTSTKGNKYEVNYNEQTNEITFTLVEQKANLAAFVGRNTLDQDTLEFTCTVNYVADTKQNTYFTNIAYIYEEKTADGIVITNQQKEDRDSEPYTNPTNNNKNKADDLKTVGDIGYKGNESNPSNLSQTDTFYKGQQDDDDFEKLVMKPKAFDLKLIKYITEVNGLDTENRVLSIDMSKINTQDPTTGKQITTGDYKLQKNPVAVEAGDFVTYTFRIYNEGDYDGYAEEISENLPEGLEFVVVADDTIYAWDGKELKDVTQEAKDYNMYEKILNTNNVWKYNKNSSIITTDILSKQKSNDNIIKAYGIEGYNNYADKANKIDYKELSVIFKVKADINPNETIRNEAAISKDTAIDKQGSTVDVDDRDSTPGNNDDSWKKDNSDKFYDEDKKWPIYGEDDEDYDNIITKAFDLSLRKQIVKINDDLYSTRFARLDTTNSEQNTIYNYYDVNSHKPAVKAGDIVTYSIRVYNEGQIDGYAKLVVDDLPSGLEFYSSTYNGVDYGWTKVQGTEKTYQTDFLSYEKDTNKGTSKSTLIKAYTGSGEADYKEIYMVCKVKDDVTTKDSLLNVAQIADDSGSRGNSVKDKDSIPGKTDKENKWKNEDDLDIENLRLKEFDLSLRKFITETETTSGEKNLVAGRNPVVSYDNGKLKYTHTKDPLTVHVGDVVTYTLRVYNEGEIDGYAATVKDNIPEYLEYLPDMATNKAYEWKMFDKDGKETTNVKDAVYVETEYLAKGHGEEAGNENSTKNLIKAFDSNKEISSVNPAYKEVKIAFKVKDPNSNKLIITNFAEISEDTDSEGKPVIDKDSTPNNGKGTPTEDDEDIENIKVEYFDLSLLKYVTKVIVNENGKQSVTQTKNVGDKNDVVPRVEINKDNINKTQVKFGYTIKVTNEGDIAGYAKEVTDYIPAGLKFDAKDNPNWKDEGNNIISTRALENTLLQPGQSAEVEVILTWINGQDNLGSKINTAEISEDYNNKGVPDRDSTPDNRKPGEDDIDTAEVLLSIKTGGGLDVVYVRLALGLLVVMLIGTVAIKKFVL